MSGGSPSMSGKDRDVTIEGGFKPSGMPRLATP
jgi:hypothetical protein